MAPTLVHLGGKESGPFLKYPSRASSLHHRQTCRSSSFKTSPVSAAITRRLPLRASLRVQAAAAPASALGFVTPQNVFKFTTVFMVPIYALLAAFPDSKVTRQVVESPVLFVGLAALYCALLAQAVMHGGLVEAVQHAFTSISYPPADMTNVATLFHNPYVIGLAWLHLLQLDFFMAKEVLLDGLRQSVFTAHSVVLCFFFGPFGMLSHLVTRKLTKAQGRRR